MVSKVTFRAGQNCTTMRFFLDTNVVIYTKDHRDPAKQAIAARWLQTLARRELAVVNLQVLNEVRHVALRKLSRLAPEDVQAWTGDLRAFGESGVDEDLVEDAWSIRVQYRLSWFDCLIVSAAERLGCSHVLTEDMGADRRVRGLILMNPFKHDVDAVLRNAS